MTKVFIDIGSNIDREVNICACIAQLREDFPDIVFSKPYESFSEGFEGADFINMSAGFETELSFQETLDYLKAIEIKQKRTRDGAKFGSRTLDVDILLFGDAILKPDRDVPRAEILKYPFVLFPLEEIAADVIHPEFDKTIAELVAETKLNKKSIWKTTLTCSNTID